MITFFDDAKKILPDNIKYWPNYLYHFSDIKNIVKILETGVLYSRNKAIELKLMENDNANKEVINQTSDLVHNQVRFYFRPLTPTQYVNEGLKKGNPQDSHCPCPIFLLFDNNIILHHIGRSFLCEQSLASHYSESQITKRIEDINNFDYRRIYHIGSYNPETNPEIKSYRHAEFCINDKVGLDDLKLIVTRSYAEKSMLLYWLKAKGITKYNNIIKCCNELGYQLMFYKRNLYIDYVDLTDDYCKIQVMNYSIDYDFKIIIKCDNDINRVFSYEIKNHLFEIDFPKNSYKKSYKVKLVVDGVVMYVGEHIKTRVSDIVF